MDESPASALTLGSRSTAARAAHIALVSVYLGAAALLLIGSGRVRLGFRKAPRVLWRALRARLTGQPPARPDQAPSADALPIAATGDAPVEPASAPHVGPVPALPPFACPRCHVTLTREPQRLVCPHGHEFPIVRGIPRFVPSDGYVRSFSREWNTHRTTQLDSAGAGGVSERTLREKTGLAPADVAGRVVLDAGVGTGRFAEILRRWGACVVGVDLSLALEAAATNLAGTEGVQLAQADIFELPFAPGTFDLIVSIGVLHHTPDTRRAFEALVPLLKPGGTIAIWVYPNEASYATRVAWIPFTRRIPADAFYDWCRWLIEVTHRHADTLIAKILWDCFPYSRQGLGAEWDTLDTFDGFSPRYHGVHHPHEVIEWFRAAGLSEVRESGPHHTSVRGRKPLGDSSPAVR